MTNTTAEFIAIKVPKPSLLPRLPKFNDRTGAALRSLAYQTRANRQLPSTRNILRTTLPSLGKDFVSNPYKTIKTNLPRLRKARVYARAATGLRIPSRKQLARRLGTNIRNTTINTGSAIGGAIGASMAPGLGGTIGGSILGSMATRKGLDAAGTAIRAVRQSKGNLQQAARAFAQSRRNRNPRLLSNSALQDVYANLLTGATPVGTLPFPNRVASALTPTFIGAKKSVNTSLLNKARKVPKKVADKIAGRIAGIKNTANKLRNARSNANRWIQSRT